MPVAAGTQNKRWVVTPADKRTGQLAGSLKISELLAQVLINRGITDPRRANTFLRPRLSELVPPEQMPANETAAKRIQKAVADNEKITIYGDYDVDGITAVAILLQLLKTIGADVDYYIPHRVDEGYGLNTEAVKYLAKAGSSLVITVDCGIQAHRSAAVADELGVDLIITDHHQPPEKLPPAAAIVHPQLDRSYPNQDSSGAMVAFKLAWQIAKNRTPGKKLTAELRDFMISATSLAAMGTIADVVELTGENRILVSYGLKSIPECQLPGVKALIDSAGLANKGLDSFDIGFRLAPMLNAAGRMGHARLAVELLASSSSTKAMQIAGYLKQQNTQRQKCEKKILKHACEMVHNLQRHFPDHKTIVLSSQQWHIGVIGIVASRLVDKFCRPAILISTQNGQGQGSARSVKGFNILKAIQAASEELTGFGGHEMAAGITLKPDNIQAFADKLENYARQNLRPEDTVAKLPIDAKVTLDKLGRAAVTELQLLGPFGQGNPRPIFAAYGVRLAAPPRCVGTGNKHLQLVIADNRNTLKCIGFGMGTMEKKLLEHDFFNVAFQSQINTYNGTSQVQLVLDDIKFE